MARTILNLNTGGKYLTMDETEQLYEDFDAQVRGEDRPIIAGTAGGTRPKKSNILFNFKGETQGGGSVTNRTSDQTLNMVSDSMRASLLANQELRKEQKKSASRSGVGGSILGGGAF